VVKSVAGAVAGQFVAVPAGEPHQMALDPQDCELGEPFIAAWITAVAAAYLEF
jgi:hypothetical protein